MIYLRHNKVHLSGETHMADFNSHAHVEESTAYAQGELLEASREELEAQRQLDIHQWRMERIMMGVGQPHYEHDCDCMFDC